MNNYKLKEKILNSKNVFESLQDMNYKSVSVNGYKLTLLGIHFMDYGPYWNVKRHHHSFYELHYVFKGNVHTAIDGVEKKIKENQFYIICPDAFHSHEQKEELSHVGLALRWEIEHIGMEKKDLGVFNKLDRFVNNMNNSFFQVYDDDGGFIKRISYLLELHENGCNLLEKQLFLFQVLVYLVNHFLKDNKEVAINNNQCFIETNIVNDVIKFIEENYSQDIGVNDIADAVHLSYSYLSKLFKNYEKVTLNEYLTSVRLRKARKLLKCSDKSIEVISRETGFTSIYYFSAVFKKQIGKSPNEYRKGRGGLNE
jgi:AraC family transcriptional regulator, transcriptional activator of pobA